jgi:hypothetical protein
MKYTICFLFVHRVIKVWGIDIPSMNIRLNICTTLKSNQDLGLGYVWEDRQRTADIDTRRCKNRSLTFFIRARHKARHASGRPKETQ